MTSTGPLDWYVVATMPKSEERAEQSLKRMELTTFVPWYVETVRRRGRRQNVRRRLFPSYVFIGVEPRRPWQWHALKEAPGVHGVVCFGTAPSRIPARDMGSIQTGSLLGLFDRGTDLGGFKPGADVRALDGVFASFCGQIVEAKDEERISVMFSLFGRPVPCELPLDSLELIHVEAR